MNVLVLTHRVPYAPNRGDRIRAFHLLKLLRRSFDVDVVSLAHDTDEAGRAAEMNADGSSVRVARVRRPAAWLRCAREWTGTRPLTHLLLDAPDLRRQLQSAVAARQPDVVLAYGSGMARCALEPPLAGIPFVVDMVDVDSAKWQALAALAAPWRGAVYRREARCLSAFEADCSDRARATLVVNAREHALLRALSTRARIEIVPNGVDADAFAPPGDPAAAPHVAFCGVMNYAPNAAAACWLAQDVWPRVIARRPDARLFLVGASPTRAVRRLARRDGTITVTGTVADVRPLLWNAAVAVAPLQTARGIQNKVLEAIAAGLPTVITSAVAAGLPDAVSSACRRADTSIDFAHAILELLTRRPTERRSIARTASLAGLAWPDRLAPVIDILRLAATARGVTAA